MSSSMIMLDGISKEYQKQGAKVLALAGLDLEITEGEFICVWGPSGSGKSTLLNILGTLDTPSSGKYYFRGTDITKYTDVELSRFRSTNIGFVFQSFNLLENLPAWENVVLPAKYAPNYDRNRARERACELLTRVGLGDRVDHLPGELSGGEEQRVAVARALMNDPDLILADEPTGNLDSASHRAILGILEELHQQGKTLVVVSHNPEVAERAQRVLELKDGKVQK